MILKLKWLLPTIFGVLCLAAPAEAAKLSSWQFDSTQNLLKLKTDGDVQPQAQLIFAPTRLVIDLPGTALGRPTVTQTIGGAIKAIRVGQLDAQTTRLVIELAPGYTIDPQQVRFRGLSGSNWTVQLPKPTYDPQQVPVVAVPSPPPTPAQTPTAPTGNPPALPPTKPPLPAPQPGNDYRGKLVIVVDPGHGGPDVGAVGINGVHEADIVLAISKQVAAALEQQGIRVVLTRQGDEDVDLEPRVALAKQVNANLFVSIHANSFDAERSDVNGLETYYYDSGNRLAQVVHNSILASLQMRDRGVRNARFYVLRNTPMPAILVEVGFVTGREDGRNLQDPAFRRQMATAITQGILQYVQQTALGR